MRRFGFKKILLLVWACALAFGLTFQAAEASARHAATCSQQCNAQCKKSGDCGAYNGNGCSCDWLCGDGTEGSSTCVL